MRFRLVVISDSKRKAGSCPGYKGRLGDIVYSKKDELQSTELTEGRDYKTIALSAGTYFCGRENSGALGQTCSSVFCAVYISDLPGKAIFWWQHFWVSFLPNSNPSGD